MADKKEEIKKAIEKTEEITKEGAKKASEIAKEGAKIASEGYSKAKNVVEEAIRKDDGKTVRELKEFSKQNTFELIFSLIFVLAFIFSFFYLPQWWNLFAAVVGAIVGVVFDDQVKYKTRDLTCFFFKQEKNIRWVLAGVCGVLAIFLPPLVFLVLGLHGGKSMHYQAKIVANDMQFKD